MAFDIRSILNANRRMIKSTPNPLDKSTIVSIYPKEIDEVKPTLMPGRFTIKPGSYEHPALLVVGTSSWWREIDEDQPLLEIPHSSVVMADSIIRDFANGLLGCNMGDKMPGLFFTPGVKNVADIMKEHKKELDIANTKQRNWFDELVRIADILWARTNGNPLAIDDNMRLAAETLGRKDKPWLKDFVSISMVNCVACGQLRNPNFPICQHCHTVVDMEAYNRLKLQKAV